MGFMARRLKKAADRWFARQARAVAPGELRQLLGIASDYLQAAFGASKAAADEAALLAWSELEGRRSRCHVDLQVSTPHLVFVVDPVAGTRRPVPVVDLVRILGPRAAAA